MMAKKYPVHEVPIAADFTVEEEFGIARPHALVRFGMPLARGWAADLSGLRICDAEGTVIPAQFSALGFYPDRTIRSVLVQFHADFAPYQSRRFVFRRNAPFPAEKSLVTCARRTAGKAPGS